MAEKFGKCGTMKTQWRNYGGGGGGLNNIITKKESKLAMTITVSLRDNKMFRKKKKNIHSNIQLVLTTANTLVLKK